MANLSTTNLSREELEKGLRHFQKIFLEDKNPQNNLRMVEIDKINLKGESLRKHSKKQLQKMKNAIKKVGYTNPVLLDEKLEIIAGELRLLAMKELGFPQIPAIILENLTEAEADIIRILDNRIAEDGEWNFKNLQTELERLFKLDITFEDLGFDAIDYDKIFVIGDSDENKVHNTDKEDGNWLNENIPSRVKLGDFWRLGDHFALCADSLKQKAFEVVMQGELAQIIITDAPYNVPILGHVCGLGNTKHEEFAMASGEMTDTQFELEFVSPYMQNCIQYSKEGSLHYHLIDWRGLNIFLTTGKKLYDELKNVCVWNKGIGGMGSMYRSQHEMVCVFKIGKTPHINNVKLGKNGRYRTNVWNYPGIRANNPESLELMKLHPTVKPVPMLHDILLDASLKNDIVLDCFGGSGSTLLAAERSKRRARLIEISPRYVDVILHRWEKETGKTAKLIKNFTEVLDENR